ncbi:hypothetical protein [Thiocapsa marina]|uniref:hypothetical protein n=1 Tax=Thiocapsa marina TaxID=244573 RepID=UPI0002D78259|nr:hypothetical protein [Thiocapsa marina]
MRFVDTLAPDPSERAGQDDLIGQATEAALLRNPVAEMALPFLVSAWPIAAPESTDVLEGCWSLLGRPALGNQPLPVSPLMPPSSAHPRFFVDKQRATAPPWKASSSGYG